MEVRRARASDRPFIRQLTLDTLDQGIPEGRDIPNEVVREAAEQHLGDLDEMLHNRREVAMLVAVDDKEPIGFLILELRHVEETTGERQTHIYNMGVAASHLGKFVDRKLVQEAARITHQRGCRYMTGRITASNERALMAALRQGFEVERYHITMACGPDGPTSMPGRPPDQRGHATARVMRQHHRRKASSVPD
ncbi:MAG: GNAT family N-acetyltransferase [Candidatus Eremiobacteraeota bacterium]|nr:GNAT family N-acetyltransferase [Candidatus Eremiobacteraeota bacterium]